MVTSRTLPQEAVHCASHICGRRLLCSLRLRGRMLRSIWLLLLWDGPRSWLCASLGPASRRVQNSSCAASRRLHAELA